MALTTAFARNGNRKAVPQTTADGSVSYDQGFGNLYALPPEEGGLFIDRAQFNQIMYDTTSAVISNQNSISTLNSKVTANQNSINTLNSKVADLESGVSTGVVNLTGNQTIAGVKTFSSPPVSATNPTANNQVANKAYVDTVGNTAVKLTGNQTIAGVKTFSSPVVVPDATATTHAVNLAQLNTKANWNAVVNLTGDQSIAGAKTFTSNITAPNITAIQNSINTINTSLSTVVSDSFTPYLILKSNPIGLKVFDLNDGDGQSQINAILAEAAKYRFFRININGTVTGNIAFNSVNGCEVVFDWKTSAKLVGNLSVQSISNARLIRLNLENGQLNLGGFSTCLLLSDINIIAPTGKTAINIDSGSTIFTDQTTGYPVKPINLTSDSNGIDIYNGSSFIAGQGLKINTTNTPTKINLSRGSFASLLGTTLSGAGNDFNIATNTVTANGIIMR